MEKKYNVSQLQLNNITFLMDFHIGQYVLLQLITYLLIQLA